MSRNAKLVLAFAFAVLVASGVWLTQGHDPERPTATAPRGAFASDRASDEPALPTKP